MFFSWSGRLTHRVYKLPIYPPYRSNLGNLFILLHHSQQFFHSPFIYIISYNLDLIYNGWLYHDNNLITSPHHVFLDMIQICCEIFPESVCICLKSRTESDVVKYLSLNFIITDITSNHTYSCLVILRNFVKTGFIDKSMDVYLIINYSQVSELESVFVPSENLIVSQFIFMMNNHNYQCVITI